MLKNIYVQNEARNNFKGWTKEGLDFLLSCSEILPEIKNNARQKLNSTSIKRNSTLIFSLSEKKFQLSNLWNKNKG